VTDRPRRSPPQVPIARRIGAWLVWWVLLMSFWVVVDNSIASDELLAGAGAAALGAFLAELAFRHLRQYRRAEHGADRP
jgi:hypothetical protein